MDGCIKYKTWGCNPAISLFFEFGNYGGDPANYELWKQAILARVQDKLGKGDCTLLPSGGMGRKEVEGLQRHLVFLKEDRAPHVVVAMCKYRYMFERSRYLQGSTFERVSEPPESILNRHWAFHEERGLEMNNRLPYIYGIWKSAKRNLRWISGVRKGESKR